MAQETVGSGGLIEARHCYKCGHEWLPRKPGRPQRCPRCQSFEWDDSAGAPPSASAKRTLRVLLEKVYRDRKQNILEVQHEAVMVIEGNHDYRLVVVDESGEMVSPRVPVGLFCGRYSNRVA